MKKLTAFGFLLLCSIFVYAQEAMVLDDAIMDSVIFFSSRLQSGSTIAVTNFEAETKELSDFIIQELLFAFANTGNMRVVERSRLEMLTSELNFSMTGAVSDETAQGIGRMIGAQILISGNISQFRDMYRIRIQAISVETAELIGTRTLNIKYDPTLTGLLGRINPADQWKYNWLYAGFNVGYSALIEEGDMGWMLRTPLGYSLYLMIQPFDLFGIAVDFGGDLYAGPSISIIPTLVIRPSIFEVNLFLGAGVQLFNGFISVQGGARGGIKAGPGVVYAEIRPIGILDLEYTDVAFHVNFTLGYQIGFIPRRK
jgi:TolB-like protein